MVSFMHRASHTCRLVAGTRNNEETSNANTFDIRYDSTSVTFRSLYHHEVPVEVGRLTDSNG